MTLEPEEALELPALDMGDDADEPLACGLENPEACEACN